MWDLRPRNAIWPAQGGNKWEFRLPRSSLDTKAHAISISYSGGMTGFGEVSGNYKEKGNYLVPKDPCFFGIKKISYSSLVNVGRWYCHCCWCYKTTSNISVLHCFFTPSMYCFRLIPGAIGWIVAPRALHVEVLISISQNITVLGHGDLKEVIKLKWGLEDVP